MTANWRPYASLTVGKQFPETPYIYEVTEAAATGFRVISSAAHRNSGAEEPAHENSANVPPLLAAVYVRGAQLALKGPPGGIHAGQKFTFHKEVRVGDKLSTVLTIMDKYERKGRNYVVCETRTHNQHGELVTSGEVTSIWGREEQ